MTTIDDWRNAAALEFDNAITLRHRLHGDPRLSGEEEPTADLVADAIGAGFGAVVAETGRAIEIGGGGRTTIALRAELDALPITERSAVPWPSTTDAMHACG
ncbi:MAG: amidohydrolase, partial [Actinomycetia bacterium]|nr:amidohydrolase [Actinomycetes bacterium]